MTRAVFIIASLLAALVTAAENPSKDAIGLEDIRGFIAAAPKATDKTDLSYVIKIPEKERRRAIEMCKAVLKKDRTNAAAMALHPKLMCGEGRLEPIAFVQDEAAARRVYSVLESNLIENYGVNYSVAVYKSHAARARRLLAEAMRDEGLKVKLMRFAEKTDVWVYVTPEEALKER